MALCPFAGLQIKRQTCSRLRLQQKAPDPPAIPKAASDSEQQGSEPRHLLPKDLAGSLKRLDNFELDTLLAAVTAEAERRGRVPKPQPQAEAKPAPRRTAVEDVVDGLTKGKLNAVRAAFKAGVKPSAIARQFGISQSDVRKALAQGLGSRQLMSKRSHSGYRSSIISSD